MAGTKISNLTPDTSLSTTEITTYKVPVSDGTNNFSVTAKILRTFPGTAPVAGDVPTYRTASTDYVAENPRWRILGSSTAYSPTPPTRAITNATNATPIVVTCVDHGLKTGMHCTIAGVLGNTNANGTFEANANTIRITDASNASPIVITTESIHGFINGDEVRVEGVKGNTAANSTGTAENPSWTVVYISTTTFSLTGSVGNAAYDGSGFVSWADKFQLKQLDNSSQVAISNTTGSCGSGATVAITVNAAGQITGVPTAAPGAAGTLYPASATLDLTVTGGGGTGGIVRATTDSGGTVTAFSMTIFTAGSGYTAGTVATGARAMVRLTTATHTFKSYDRVIVTGVTGTTEANNTTADDTWQCFKADATHIDLLGTTYSNAYVSGGTVELAFANDVINIAGNAAYISSVPPGTMTRPGRITLIDCTTEAAANALGFYIGLPIRMKTASTTTYGLIVSLPAVEGYPYTRDAVAPVNGANELTFAGPPLTGTLTELAVGRADMVEVVTVHANKYPYFGSQTDLPLSQLIQGTADTSAFTDRWRASSGGGTLFGTFGDGKLRWMNTDAFMVAYGLGVHVSPTAGFDGIRAGGTLTVTLDRDRAYNAYEQHTDGYAGKGTLIAKSNPFTSGDRMTGLRGQIFYATTGTATTEGTGTVTDTSVVKEGGFCPDALIGYVVGATNATPIVITTAAAHGLTTGCKVSIVSVSVNMAANVSQQAITRVSANSFSLDAIAGNGVYGGIQTTKTITGVTGYKPILTTTNSGTTGTINVTAHGFANPDVVIIENVAQTNVPEGQFTVQSSPPPETDSFTITTTASSSVAGVGGTVYKTPVIVTAVAHGFTTGDTVVIEGVTGNTYANGLRKVTVLTADTFSITDFRSQPTLANGTYAGGGTVTKAGGFVMHGLEATGKELILESLTFANNTGYRIEDLAQSPAVNIDIGGQLVSTQNGYRGIRTARLDNRFVYNEPAEINPLSYDVVLGSRFDVACMSLGNLPGLADSTEEGLGGAEFLTIVLAFVLK